MNSDDRRDLLGISFVVSMSLALVIIFFFFWNKGNAPEGDPVFDTEITFITSTPETNLMSENGWWSDMATQKPSTIPSMPEINLLDASPTPLSATQTALALTPSITPTRTPLFDVNATKTPTFTPTKDE